jgi:hypothetical protein
MSLDGESGVSVVLVAASLFMLMGFAAMSIDMPLGMNERRTAQNAADHAALSATWVRCTGGTHAAAVAAAEASVVRNGYAVGELTIQNPSGNRYEVQVDTSSQALFARVLGFAQVDVSTRAEADCKPGGGGGQAIFALGDTCGSYGKLQIDIPGSDQTVYGGVHSNDNAHVGGSSNDFGPGNPGLDPFTYVTNFSDGGGGNGYDVGYPHQVGALPNPVPYQLSDYSSNPGIPASEYHFVSGDLTSLSGDGLYYVTGDVDIGDSSLTANITIVAEGEIKVGGSDQNFTPYMDGLLLYSGKVYTGIEQCDKFVVAMSGSSNDWSGIIYGPGGLIEMSGSSNTALTGSLIGYAVRLNGSDLTIIADPDLFPGDPLVRLLQ